jgi:hypothetical protein
LVDGNRSVVLGGQNITGSTDDTVYVPNLNINTAPSNDDSLTQVLVRASDGVVKYKSASSFGGGTSFTGGTVAGATSFTGGLTANTFSATTYYGLPTDVYITGGTYFAGTTTFTNTTGGTFNVDGYYTGATLSTNNIFIGDATNTPISRSVSGDILISVSGVTTIQPNVVTYSKMQIVSQESILGSTSVSGGTVEEIPIVDGYITSGGTISNLLDDATNWDINGVYTGATISGTYQGQSHYNPNYWFTAIDDNVWIRLIRG